MGIFNFIKSKRNNGKSFDKKKIKKICQKEGVPFSETMFSGFDSEIPPINLYMCESNNHPLLYIGETKQTKCPKCGGHLKFINAVLDDSFVYENIEKQIIAIIHFKYALDCFNKKNLEPALKSLTRSIEVEPEFIDAYFNRSEVRIHKGDLTGAIEDCNHVLNLNPIDSDALINRGSAKAMLGDYKGGYEDTNRAILLKSSKPIIFFNRGICLLNMGKITQAIPDFKKFIKLAPDDPNSVIAKKLLNDLYKK